MNESRDNCHPERSRRISIIPSEKELFYEVKNSEQLKQDIFKTMFGNKPEDRLPSTFNAEMMRQIRKEAFRISQRNKAIRLLALIISSILTIGLAVAVWIYLELPPIRIEFPQVSIPSYYLYFGFLVLILLFADHLARQVYYKKTVKS